jgi:hypothetical protein
MAMRAIAMIKNILIGLQLGDEQRL